MYMLFITLIVFALITFFTLKRTGIKKFHEIQYKDLYFGRKNQPAFALRLPDFTPVSLKVGHMFASVEAPTKNLKRVRFAPPK